MYRKYDLYNKVSRIFGKEWKEWQKLSTDYIQSLGHSETKNQKMMLKYFLNFLVKENIFSPSHLFENKSVKGKYKDFILHNISIEKVQNLILYTTSGFVDWVRDALKVPHENILYFGRKKSSKFDPKLYWLVEKHGPEWEEWRELYQKWYSSLPIKKQSKNKIIQIAPFFNYLIVNQYSSVKKFFTTPCLKLHYLKFIKSVVSSEKALNGHLYPTSNFLDWVASTNVRFTNPLFFPKDTRGFDFTWLTLENGPEWKKWQSLAKSWISTYTCDSTRNRKKAAINNLFQFFIENNIINSSKIDSNLLNNEELQSFFGVDNYKKIIIEAEKFLDWVILKLSLSIDNPLKVLPSPKQNDVDFSIVTHLYGSKWEEWRVLANNWVLTQKRNSVTREKRTCVYINLLFTFLYEHGRDNPALFFNSQLQLQDLEEFIKGRLQTAASQNDFLYTCSDFLSWVVSQLEIVYKNPFYSLCCLAFPVSQIAHK